MQSTKVTMKNFVQVLTSLQGIQGAGTKNAIQAVLATADEGTRALIWHALNPYLTYGVRKFAKPATYGKDGYADHNQFLDLLQALSSRSLTGNAASQAVTTNLALYPKDQADLLELVLEKDLKGCGFSAETYNKVWAGKDDLWGTIPTFDVMLADKCETPEEFLEKITFPCQGDWKYDGQRTICIVRAGRPVEYRARSGKESTHLNGLMDEDLLNIRAAVGYDFVMDGEAFASDFTQTINAKKSGDEGQAAKDAIKLRAFFMMPLEAWMAQKTTITMRQNRDFLRDRLHKSGCAKVILSEGREVKDYADMVAYCNEVIDTHKQEGLILKNWDSVYQWDRTVDWTKVKRMHDLDCKIVAWYPGRPKSRLENTVGGITVIGKDEKGRIVKTNVGSGFSDAMRDHIRDNWAMYEGATAVITYQEISKAKGSDDWSLRFPVFSHTRDDKIVEAF
jgi:DNA ligase-1